MARKPDIFKDNRTPEEIAKWQVEFEALRKGPAFQLPENIATKEADPTGKPLSTPGAKADAGKPNVTRGALHYFPRAITEVARLSEIGARKYSWKGWENVPDGIHRYGGALGRHELKIEDDHNRIDQDTGVLEATAVAWNALARLELILRENEGKEKLTGDELVDYGR